MLNISISQNVSITPETGITDEVNRCYQPSVDEKYEARAGNKLYEGMIRTSYYELICV